ncbi:MAG: formylglycine-generating enzyme family protein [Gammaproteobacteria bacterium]|nr:formylglycine-generating enzyme family protein [Gammaproteobacteria bacterium]
MAINNKKLIFGVLLLLCCLLYQNVVWAKKIASHNGFTALLGDDYSCAESVDVTIESKSRKTFKKKPKAFAKIVALVRIAISIDCSSVKHINIVGSHLGKTLLQTQISKAEKWRLTLNDDGTKNNYIDKSSDYGFAMVELPGGEAFMGCVSKVKCNNSHSLSIWTIVPVSPFKISKYEVTYGQWSSCVADGVCKEHGYIKRKEKYKNRLPANSVSWDEVTHSYIPWLNKKTGRNYRLPTEAEWVYAARAGTKTRFHWGDEITEKVACLGLIRCRSSVPVGSYKPNAFGLYDMIGNVDEWVQDCWNTSASSVVDRCDRVLRGGSFAGYEHQLGLSFRLKKYQGGTVSSAVGFRLAEDVAHTDDYQVF